MLEMFNRSWFLLINATPASAEWQIDIARFFAQDMILIVPVLIAILWLWGPSDQVNSQRRLVIKVVLSLLIGLVMAQLIGHVFPHPRPFVAGIGYTLLKHAPDSSFPSDHGTISFTLAVAFLLWHRIWSGAVLLLMACAIAWSRIFLGVHWPLDMIGAFLNAICSCLLAQIIWNLWGDRLHQFLHTAHRFCFAILIRKGWVRG